MTMFEECGACHIFFDPNEMKKFGGQRLCWRCKKFMKELEKEGKQDG